MAVLVAVPGFLRFRVGFHVHTDMISLLWFNLVGVEIRELRPEVVAESNEVLVHYRSRTNV